VFSACLAGIEAALVRVEVDVTHGLPAFATVGRPDSAVRESRDRVRAVTASGDGAVMAGALPKTGRQRLEAAAVALSA
jgi:hypothetical protein